MNKNIKRITIALLLTSALSQPAFAQTMIDGSDVKEVLNIARGYGAASLDKNDRGDPVIRGRIDGNAYYLAFLNCSSETSCEDFFIQSYFLNPIVDYKLINEWNYDKRWTKIYYDKDMDVVLEMDFNLDGGVSLLNLEQTFSLWSKMLGAFHDGYLTKKEK